MTFLIADGIAPGNTDREYVLRRLMRRAIRHGRYLGIHGVFLDHVCKSVVEAMGTAYAELRGASTKIEEIAIGESERFNTTLDRGLELLEAERERIGARAGEKRVLSGEVAFRLYDTYGFPLDLTQDVLRDDEIEVDVAQFNLLMERQRERGRAARKEETAAPEIILRPGVTSRFIYGGYEAESQVIAAHADADKATTIVTAETPFYPEGGGQVGDHGVIETAAGARIEITGHAQGMTARFCMWGGWCAARRANSSRRRIVKLRIDRARRQAAMLNHSATHILHYALRQILGKERSSGGIAGGARAVALRLQPSGSRQARRPGDDRGRD